MAIKNMNEKNYKKMLELIKDLNIYYKFGYTMDEDGKILKEFKKIIKKNSDDNL